MAGAQLSPLEKAAHVIKQLIIPDVRDPVYKHVAGLPEDIRRLVYEITAECGQDHTRREVLFRSNWLALGHEWGMVENADPALDLDQVREGWNFHQLGDTFEVLPPLVYLVDGVISKPSVSIFFGAPKSLKTLLVLDMAVCVASGRPWLGGIAGGTVKGVKTKPAPVMWLDFENGYRRMHERIGAFARDRELPPETPFIFTSMPSPWLEADKDEQIDRLVGRIVSSGAGLVVIDHLSQVLGEVEENGPGMSAVMANIRQVAELAGVALVLVHHQIKNFSGKYGKSRAGDSLRGHGSIEANVDLAMLIRRQDGPGNEIDIIPTAVRGADIEARAAFFQYTHRAGTRELERARFYGSVLESVSDRVRRAIQEVVDDNPGINQTLLRQKVREQTGIGDQTVRAEIEALEDEGRISSETVGRAKQYTLGDAFGEVNK